MIDIHNHILFDIDDGAKTIEASVQMCRDAYKNGIEHIVLTPHFVNFSDVENFIEERDSRIFELRNMLNAERIPVKLYAGAELYLSDGVFSADNLDELTLGNSKYILCEFPLGPFNINRVPEWIDELIDRGYVPVIAHPERYHEFHRNLFIIDELIDRYGDIPKPVENLLMIALIRANALKCNIVSITQEGNEFKVTPSHIDIDIWSDVEDDFDGKMKIVLSSKPYISVRPNRNSDALKSLNRALEKYVEIATMQ